MKAWKLNFLETEKLLIMSVCKTCGVDLGQGNERCPLCDPDETKDRIISPADVFNLSRKENTKQLYELTMLLLFSAIAITIAIDAVFEPKGMNWSLLTTTCIGYAMAFITIIHFFRIRPFWLLITGLASTVVLLYFLDLFTGNRGWFRALAGPVTISFFVLAGVVVILNSLSRYRGLNLIATIMLALAIFVVIIECYADRYLYGIFEPQWSIVTAASMFILALILIFVHYRLKRGRSLGRLFHI